MAVLLDTTVVSELIRKAPDRAVEAWVASHALEELFFSAIGEAEMRCGAAILSADHWRESLVSDIERMLRDAFDGRVLPFDTRAARAYADIAAVLRSAGHPVAPVDCQVAAIARSRGMAVATRNVRDFDDIDIEVVNPWRAA